MPPRIMLIGEAWGEEEELQQLPFVGPSGRLLNAMLAQAGLDRSECYLTNVFNLRPRPTNDVENLCGPRSEAIPNMPHLRQSKYIRAEYGAELTRLYSEINKYNPTLIVALGATPTWALLHNSTITKIRGTCAIGVTGHKVLPTYHPAAVLRNYSWRPVVVADLQKAKREATFPEVRTPERVIWIEPTLSDLPTFEREHIAPSPELSIDIETAANQITCIGFAPTPAVALVIPFYDPRKPDGNYWSSLEEELKAWYWVRRQCERTDKHITGQNYSYDMSFLWRSYGIRSPGFTNDTMLAHHALQPEMEKSLAFLGSIYTDEASWKFMRGKHQTIKRED